MTPAPASHVYFSQRLRLHYIDWRSDPEAGSTTSTPSMLLVHGIHDHCRTWDDLAAEFVNNYHVVAPDLRGHGDSEWVRGSSYHYLDYIYDLHQLVQQADLAPVVLVGHSMGGAIAAMFAGIYPELVSKLVVIEGIGLWSAMQPAVPVQDRIREWVDTTRSLSARLPRRYADLSEAYHRMQHANPQLSESQALHLTVHGSNQNEDGTYSWKYDNYTHNFSAGGLTSEDTVALWQRIDCPVLIMTAENGMEHRIGQDNTAQYFGDHRRYEVAAAGHWTYHDQHDQVQDRIQQFLDEPV